MLSVKEVAEIVGVHPSTVYRWVESGHLPAYRYGQPAKPGPKRGAGGAIRIPQEAIADSKAS